MAAALTSSERGLVENRLAISSNAYSLGGVCFFCHTATDQHAGRPGPRCGLIGGAEMPGPLFQYMSMLARRGSEHHPRPNGTGSSRPTFPLSRDHLLPLVEFNIMRAAVTNMSILGIDYNADLCSSYWCTLPLFPAPATLPSTLVPTTLQLTIPHERWIDLLPDPRMRDNAIREQDNFDSTELERDLLGYVCDDEAVAGENPTELSCLLFWADPWRPGGVELTEGFIRKWGFLVKGCDELFRATDRWRVGRGEEPLRSSIRLLDERTSS